VVVADVVQGALRLDVEPIFVHRLGEPRIVFGGTLLLHDHGPAGPPLQPGAAEVVLHAVYFERARPSARKFELGAFAKLACSLEVPTSGGPILAFESESAEPVEMLQEVEGREDPQLGTIPPLSVRLQFGAGFAGIEALRVPIPPSPEKAEFLELHFELKLDGAAPADVANNGRLDLALGLLDFVIVEMRDDKDEPIPGGNVRLQHQGEIAEEGTADDEGRFAINGVPRGKCVVVFSEPSDSAVAEDSAEGEEVADADEAPEQPEEAIA
jgi:hypothetical protein